MITVLFLRKPRKETKRTLTKTLQNHLIGFIDSKTFICFNLSYSRKFEVFPLLILSFIFSLFHNSEYVSVHFLFPGVTFPDTVLSRYISVYNVDKIALVQRKWVELWQKKRQTTKGGLLWNDSSVDFVRFWVIWGWSERCIQAAVWFQMKHETISWIFCQR